MCGILRYDQSTLGGGDFFDGFMGVICLIYTVFWISIYAEDVVNHALVPYGCRLWGASILDTFPLIANEVHL